MAILQSKLKTSRVNVLKWDKHSLMPNRVKKLRKVKIEFNVEFVVWKIFWAIRLADYELKEAKTPDTSYYKLDTMSGIAEIFTYHGRKAWCYEEGSVFNCIGIKLHSGFDIGYMHVGDLNRICETSSLPCRLLDTHYTSTLPRVRYNRKSEK